MAKSMGVNELRKSYLEFFESKDHLKLNSFSLVPQNDKSLLLINAGMAPMKPYFTGQEIPPRNRVCTCQKCVRTGDIENVGKTARHLTFFEMLGNFSFGDYFKREAIHWSWEFLTKVIGLEEDRLYPSIYGEDDEAFDIWNKEVGVPAEKITRFYRDPVTKECDNFWEHGAGPCGPCSEIYYDRGLKYGCGKPDCKVGCDCDRFMEVWNNVFTQFENDGHGNYTELIQKNIDTGMGLERLAVVVQDVDTVFDIDTMRAIRDAVCNIAGVQYETDDKKDVSIRLITDHIRSVTFMTSDGITPGNSGRGYVLRRLLRRAARHGRLLGINDIFLAKLCQVVIDECKDGYPELEEKREMILNVITNEEITFNKTIDKGLAILSDMEEECNKAGSKVLSGENAFKLYDTYGFPMDLTEEILEDKGMTLDMDGFKACMEKQKNLARNDRKAKGANASYMGADASVYDLIDTSITSKFVGYENLEYTSKITVLTTETELTDTLSEGQVGTIIVEETPFYATMGGQEADNGVITFGESVFEVTDVIKLKGGRIGHVGVVESGSFMKGNEVTLTVDKNQRLATAKNHSATHLLQEALREVLGNHVEQKGSLVNEDRLRFDFSHFSAMTKEEIQKVETIVNEKINANLAIVTKEMAIDEARKTGAKALFGEKYGEVVRVVNMGDWSIELCGGTHAENTGIIGSFKILSESGIAAGTRRIEALTGDGVLAFYKEMEEELLNAAKEAKCEPKELASKIDSLLAEIKTLKSENDKLKNKLAANAAGDITNNIIEKAGVTIIAADMGDADPNALKTLGDEMKAKYGNAYLLFVSNQDGKVSIVSMASDEAVKKGAHCGNLIKNVAGILGGGGGGRPNMAQAGGKDASKISEAVDAAKQMMQDQIQ
ncbi:MAG: alanine--tRNA ligase [Lachnospiraceae bacterium]|nr:alanine--tRNA ligase [Lachnospiraceae bacterium]